MLNIQPKYLKHLSEQEGTEVYDVSKREDDERFIEALIQTRVPQRVTHGIMPFEALNVQPDSKIDVFVQPEVMFKGTRIVVEPEIAKFFSIYGFRVGHSECVLMANGGVPATMFPPFPPKLGTEERRIFEQLCRLSFDTCGPATRFRLTIRNDDSVPRHFKAIVWGVCAF